MKNSPKAKDLSSNVQILLQKSSPQLMLTRVAEMPDFAKFLNGEFFVKVFTPSRNMFQAVIRNNKINQTFRLEPRSIIPNDVETGSTLLLVFPLEKDNFIVQCMVDSFSLTSISLKSLDPRINARRLALIPGRFHPVTTEDYTLLCNGKIRIFREIEINKGKSNESVTILRDIFSAAENTDPNNPNEESGDQSRPNIPVLITDISPGGCCIQFRENSDNSLPFDPKFGFLNIDIPSPLNKAVRIGIIIRQSRKQQDCRILHCMFLERLPDGFLNL